MRILVTGANGFVGSHVLLALAADDDHEVVAACRNPAALPPGFDGDIRRGDLRDAAYLDTLCEGIDTVCHAAAWTSLFGQSDASRRLFLEPALGLIDAARRAGVRHFINTSTTSAAAPRSASQGDEPGIERRFWPHLNNVIHLENRLRTLAEDAFRVTNLRLGIFIGERYGLGLLPILVPRLRTHLVPWVAGGRTPLPLLPGEDIGEAFRCAVAQPPAQPWRSLNIVGRSTPTVREVIDHLHVHHGLPRPHFSVPFAVAHRFAAAMEAIDGWVSWDPLVTRSIVHLLEDTGADNAQAEEVIGYRPRQDWRETIDRQLDEMGERETRPMRMWRPMAEDREGGHS